MSPKSELVTKSEFARRNRLDESRVRKLVVAGLPTKDGKIPVKAATAWLKQNVDPARKNHWRGTTADAALNELRRQREVLRIDVARLELKKAEGEVVDRAVVKRFIVARATMERDSWSAWASAASARLAAALAVDTGRLFGLLESEVRDHLRRLADTPLDEGGE